MQGAAFNIIGFHPAPPVEQCPAREGFTVVEWGGVLRERR